ncbi:uncharacterized protein LOC121530027 [Drosophila eugracilis]|uniref:uncharacterized protein LOC121530027 n=1 Tax=Drosophila eugracilis TaxID=29029 RepID=UPI001BDA9DD1|nr:uncharacterized protein LOC121530027 [Drosophila eugracilis]
MREQVLYEVCLEECDVGTLFALDALDGQVFSDNHYQVVGVDCKENEAVSCMMIKCPADRFCPAENFCYNPKCVCRKGFRRHGGICVPKHDSLHLSKATLDTALLEIPYREF